MLKIVEVHPATTAQGEYVVLQNQGVMTVLLKGWALCTDAFLEGDALRSAYEMYIFRTDAAIKPFTHVVLFTGCGEDGWVPTHDGKQAYCAYWNRTERVWSLAENIHALHIAASRRILQAPRAEVPFAVTSAP